jgi:long-chain acyl-CoA synthetase
LNERAVAEAERLRESRGRSAGVERWQNLPQMFFDQARGRDAPFLWAKRGGSWRPIRWSEAARMVSSLSIALRALGIEAGDRVVIAAENRPEYCLWDLAIMTAGAVSVPVAISQSPADCAHILANSGAVAAIVAPKAAENLLASLAAGRCRLLITMDALAGPAPAGVAVHAMADLLAGHPADVGAVEAGLRMGRRDVACLIYTSGTAGAPRGVMQHHGAILHNLSGCIDIIASDFPSGPAPETFLSFLPLAHAYEHTAGQFLPIALGGQIYYAEGLERLGTNLVDARPTIMVVVPRLFEVFRGRLLREAERRGPMAARLLGWAVELGRRSAGRQRPRLVDWPLDLLLERLVRRPVRQRFGGHLKAMVSGGAPLNPEVGLFFQALGLTILQGYGETEAGPVISCNRPAAGVRMDSVGPPLADTDVRIAEDGEILVDGELVMLGYWNDAAATAAALEGGWLHTGDIGHIDVDGHLVITDRKKDILVSDKGENIAPQRIEGMLTMQPEIAQAMVYGDRRPYLVCLIVPDAEFRMEWAARHGRDIQTSDHDPGFIRAIQAAVDRVNEALAPHERVRRILLAAEAFTVENGQLTFTQKLRRHVLRARYGERLDALYN